MKSRLLCLLLFVVTLGLGGPVQAQRVTQQWLQEDKRLGQKITLSAPRLYLGELLEKVSAQSGVRLVATDKDHAAGEPLSVHLVNVPLQQVMDSLWSLVGYQDALWQWKRGDEATAPSYVLTRPNTAQNLSKRVHDLVQADFERDFQRRVQAGDEIVVAFLEAVPEAERMGVLRGELEKKIHLDDLGPRAKKQLDSTLKGSSKAAPRWVRFYTKYDGGYPSLYFGVDGRGSFSLVGYTRQQEQWRSELLNRWFLPQDVRSHPTQEALVWEQDRDKQVRAFQRQSLNLTSDLQVFADDLPLSFMAHLPLNDGGQRLKYKKQTVGSVLRELGEKPGLVYKWRGDILLLSYPEWFTQDADKDNTIYWVVKKFREWRETKQAPVLAELCQLAVELSDTQLRSLETRFPPLQTIWLIRSVLRWAALSPQNQERLQSDTGAAVNPELRKALLTFLPKSDVSRTHFVRLTRVQEDTRLLYTLFLINEDSHPYAVASMSF